MGGSGSQGPLDERLGVTAGWDESSPERKRRDALPGELAPTAPPVVAPGMNTPAGPRPTSRDYGREAQEAAEKHLLACLEAQWDEDGNETDGEGSPSVGPFCGCETCVVREVLYAAWPIMELSVLERLADVRNAEEEDHPDANRDGSEADVTE